jgi:hypothetical protein
MSRSHKLVLMLCVGLLFARQAHVQEDFRPFVISLTVS